MNTIPYMRRIGTKIIGIFLLALLPLVAVIAYLNIHMRRDALEQGRNMVFRAAFEAAAAQDAVVSDLRRMLRRLADSPAARSGDAAALEKELQLLRRSHAYLSNVAVCDAAGNLIASAVKPVAGVNAASRRFYAEALRRKDFAAGQCGIGQVTGNPVLPFAQPIQGPDGSPAGLAVAAVNLRYFPTVLGKLEMLPRGGLTFLDTQGRLLAQVPRLASCKPGDSLTTSFAGRFSWGQSYGSFVATGPGGVETLYAYQVLRLPGDSPAPYGAILAGMPVSVAMEASRHRMYVSIFASAGSLLAAVLLAVGLSRVVIVHRLEVLAGFAASLKEEKVCRLPPHFGRDEIGLLGKRLADMSRELHDKSDHLAVAMASLGRERDRLSVVVGELSEAREELERRACLDFLTGLRNRRSFSEKMRLELTRLNRYAKPFSLVLFDIDDFKKINDTYGHNVGDLVLQRLARLTLATVRGVDEAYRVGGEEFALVLPETDGHSAMILAERLRRGVADMRVPLPGEGAVRITVSLGVVEAWAGAHEDTDIFASADDALYAAKRSGKNASVLSDGPKRA